MIYGCLGRFCDALHQFFLCNAPHIRGTFHGVDHSFANTSVCTADTNVLVGSAETTHGMSFEMCQDKHGIIICDMASHSHMVKPVPVPMDAG